MARVLAYSSPGKGHLFPLVPTLDALRAHGHEVTLMTTDGELPLMREHGFDLAAIDPEIAAIELEDWKSDNPRKALALSVRDIFARARFDAPDLEAAIERVRPDVVIVDANAWGACATAEAWGGPWALFCPFPLPLSSVDAPPFGPSSGVWQ